MVQRSYIGGRCVLVALAASRRWREFLRPNGLSLLDKKTLTTIARS